MRAFRKRKMALFNIAVVFAFISLVLGGCALLNPEPVSDGKLEIVFVSEYYSLDPKSTVAQDMFAEIDGLRSVKFDFVYANNSVSRDKVMMFFAGKRGDVMVVERSLLKTLVDEMAVAPLDEFIDAGIIDMEGLDVSSVKMICNPSDTYADDFDRTRRIYGVPSGKMFGLMKDFLVDNRSAVMIIPSYSADKELAAEVVQWMKERYSYDARPEFAVKFDQIIKELRRNGGEPDRRAIDFE